MYKSKFSRLKSAALSGILAVTAVAGSMSAAVKTSPSTADAADSSNYARLLQYSLYFYDANMCGDVSGCGLSWRSNCHMDDEVPGGFHDAGDHAMFGQPQGYTASTLGWAYYEFPDAFSDTGQADHLKLITDKFCKFFRDATVLNGNTVSKVLIEKGEGNVDHAYWGPPEKQGYRGRMLWSTGGAANVTAEYAAALAVNYVNFKNADDLKYAEALYEFSKKDTGFYTAQGGGETFYDAHWTGTSDELAWAAGWLYKATGNSKYLDDLKKAPTAYSAHSWESVQLGASMLKGEFTSDWSGTDYLGKFTGNGYCIAEPDAWQWGSARYNCSAQFTTLVAAKHGKGTADWAKGQMEYILGKKGVGSAPARCFVVGFDSTSPVNVHHRAASGYQNYDEMGDSTVAKSGSPVLVGALAGGPADTNGTYSDSIKDYKCNEVALDYNAGLVGAAAGLYHFYKTGEIDKNITGVTKIYSGSSIELPTSQTTTQSQIVTQANPTTTQPTVTGSTGDGYVEYKPNQKVVYKEGMEMIGWEWADIGVGAKDKVSKVEIDISTNKSSLGKWQGAFGTSTTVAADKYWTMTKDMQETFSGNKGTITWDVPSSTSSIIQTQYHGELKFGVWWIDCGEFTIDAIRVYTDGSSSQTTTQTTTTTQKPTTNIISPTKLGDANCDGIVNIADAVLVMQVATNPDKYDIGKSSKSITAIGWANGDVNESGSLTNQDALLIQKFKLGLIKSF